MSNDRSEVQQERQAGDDAGDGAKLPARPQDLSWDSVLERASSSPSRELIPAPPGTVAPERAVIWLKALLPLAILLVYIGLKWWQGAGNRGTSPWNAPAPVASISGVDPTQSQETRIDARTREFLGQLEALAVARRWTDVVSRIKAEPEPAVREHPVVAGLGTLAEVRAGARGTETERRVMDAIAALEPSATRFPDLLKQLRLAQAQFMAARSTSPVILHRNTDTLFRLVGRDASSDYAVDVRLDIAAAFEQAGDTMVEQGSGILRDDPVMLREARSVYQSGLRFLVTDAGWAKLTPVSERTRPSIERNVGKIRELNRRIHGTNFFPSSKDNTTWSGNKGGLIHDAGATP